MGSWLAQFNLKPFRSLDEDEVIQIVSHALTHGSHSTSYKFGFFKSILDNLFNADISGDEEFLSYDLLASRFIEIYWNLILHFRLRQMPKTSDNKRSLIGKLLEKFCTICNLDYSSGSVVFPFESLKYSYQLELTSEAKGIMKKNVVAAFCGDTQNDFYHFDKRAGSTMDGISFNHDAYISLVKYKTSFEKLNYFEWIKYMEKVNEEEDAYALATKLDASTERTNLNAYRKVLESFGQTRCFYCGKILKKEEGLVVAETNITFPKYRSVPVDHFIPWSFIKDDKIWNFVLACEQCNSKKKDILPSMDFVYNLEERNDKLSNFDNELVQKDFKDYAHFKIRHIYSSAVSNGFDCNWEPKKKS